MIDFDENNSRTVRMYRCTPQNAERDRIMQEKVDEPRRIKRKTMTK